jgi:hypothetical protein
MAPKPAEKKKNRSWIVIKNIMSLVSLFVLLFIVFYIGTNLKTIKASVFKSNIQSDSSKVQITTIKYDTTFSSNGGMIIYVNE